MFNFSFLTRNVLLAVAAGIVVGAVGYKLIAVDKKISPKEIANTFENLTKKQDSKEDSEAK